MPRRFVNYQDYPQSPEERRWLRPIAIDLVIANVRNTQNSNLAACVLVFAVLYTHTAFATWCFWLFAHVVVLAMRIRIMRGYLAKVDDENPEAAVSYFHKHKYIIALSGLLWGGTTYLFYSEKQNLLTVAYLIFVITYAYSSVINFTSYYPTLRNFLMSYGSGLIIALLVVSVLRPALLPDYSYWVLMLGVCLLIATMLKQGNRFNRAYINTMLLQYKNMQLIDSLRVEKQSALDAITDKNRLIASTAHDMRQPVLALDLYSQMLAEDISMAAVLTPKICAATQGVISLFDSMFDLAQIKEDQVKINLTEISVLSVLQSLSHQHQIIAENKGLFFRTRLQDHHIQSDPLLFKRIVSNLISNAIKYTQTGGVLVASRQKNQRLLIAVWDTGSGIAEHEHGLVFHEFYKSPSQTGTNDGFGLGLSIVKQLSEKLGYTLHLKSRNGVGTMMAIEIPLRQGPQT